MLVMAGIADMETAKLDLNVRFSFSLYTVVVERFLITIVSMVDEPGVVSYRSYS